MEELLEHILTPKGGGVPSFDHLEKDKKTKRSGRQGGRERKEEAEATLIASFAREEKLTVLSQHHEDLHEIFCYPLESSSPFLNGNLLLSSSSESVKELPPISKLARGLGRVPQDVCTKSSTDCVRIPGCVEDLLVEGRVLVERERLVEGGMGEKKREESRGRTNRRDRTEVKGDLLKKLVWEGEQHR